MSSSNKCQHHCRFQCLLLFPAIISYKPAFSAKDVLISLAGAIFAHGNVPSRFDCVTIIAGASLIKIKKNLSCQWHLASVFVHLSSPSIPSSLPIFGWDTFYIQCILQFDYAHFGDKYIRKMTIESRDHPHILGPEEHSTMSERTDAHVPRSATAVQTVLSALGLIYRSSNLESSTSTNMLETALWFGVVLRYTSWAHGSHRQLKDINDMNKLYPTISSFRRKWLKANGPFHSLDLSTRETWTQWTTCGPFSSTSSCSGIFRFKNCDELFDHTVHIWYHQITPKDCKKFMHSMPNRIRAVVRREAKNKWQISVSELFKDLIMAHARILKRIYKMGLESKHFCRCAWLA